MKARRQVQSGKERVFIQQMIATGDGPYSAAQAGYAYPAQSSYFLQQKPAVRQEILDGQAEVIATELLPLSVERIRRVLTDARTKDADVIKATTLVWRKAFEANGGAGRDLSEMSASEIEALLSKAKSKLIDVTPLEGVFA